jgi:hypothetical protein
MQKAAMKQIEIGAEHSEVIPADNIPERLGHASRDCNVIP